MLPTSRIAHAYTYLRTLRFLLLRSQEIQRQTGTAGSACQIRIGGAKGVLQADPVLESPGMPKIVLTESMVCVFEKQCMDAHVRIGAKSH